MGIANCSTWFLYEHILSGRAKSLVGVSRS